MNIQQYFLLLFNLSRRFGKRAIRAAWLSCHTGVLLGLRCRIRIGRFARLGSRNIRRRNFRRLFRGRLGSRFRFIGDVGFFQNIHIAQQPAAGLVFHQRAPQGLAGLGYAQLAVEKLPQHKHRHGAVETIAAVLPHIPFMQPNDDAAAYAQIFRLFIPHRLYRKSMQTLVFVAPDGKAHGVAHLGMLVIFRQLCRRQNHAASAIIFRCNSTRPPIGKPTGNGSVV